MMALLQTVFFVLAAGALADDDWLTRVSTYTVAYGNACGCPTLPAGFGTTTVAATTATTVAHINRRKRSADVKAVAIIPKASSCVLDCTCYNYSLNNCTCGSNPNITSCYCTNPRDPYKTCYCANSTIMCPIINGPSNCHYVSCGDSSDSNTTNTTSTNTTDSYTNCTYSGSCVVDCTCANYNLSNCTCGNNASATTSCYCTHKNDPYKTCYCSNSSIMCPIINGPPHCHYVRCENGNDCSSDTNNTNTTYSSSNCKCIYAWKPVTYYKPLMFHTHFRITNIACTSSITISGTASYIAYRSLIIQLINTMFSVSFGAKYFKNVDSNSITFSCGSLVVESNVNFNGSYFTSDQVTTMMSDSLTTAAAAYNLTADAKDISSSSVSSSTAVSTTAAAVVTTQAAQKSSANSLKAREMSLVLILLTVLGVLQSAF